MFVSNTQDLFQTSAFSSVGEGYYHGLADKRSAKVRQGNFNWNLCIYAMLVSFKISRLVRLRSNLNERKNSCSKRHLRLWRGNVLCQGFTLKCKNCTSSAWFTALFIYFHFFFSQKKARIRREQTFSSARTSELEDPVSWVKTTAWFSIKTVKKVRF
jgi:hypothetical protein